MNTYFYVPSARHFPKIGKLTVWATSLIAVVALLNLGMHLATITAKESPAIADNLGIGDRIAIIAIALSIMTAFLINAYTVIADFGKGFAFQLDGRDDNPDGSRKWISRSHNQLMLLLTALAGPLISAASSQDTGYLSFVVYGSLVAVLVTMPAVAFVRSRLYRAEQWQRLAAGTL